MQRVFKLAVYLCGNVCLIFMSGNFLTRKILQQ
jgi:hypothetical protein